VFEVVAERGRGERELLPGSEARHGPEEERKGVGRLHHVDDVPEVVVGIVEHARAHNQNEALEFLDGDPEVLPQPERQEDLEREVAEIVERVLRGVERQGLQERLAPRELHLVAPRPLETRRGIRIEERAPLARRPLAEEVLHVEGKVLAEGAGRAAVDEG